MMMKRRKRRRMRKRAIITEEESSSLRTRKTMRILTESMRMMKVMPLTLKSVQPNAATTSKTVPPPSVVREPSLPNPAGAEASPSTRATSDNLS